MKELTKEQVEAINRPLPVEAIRQHPTKKFLSTINAIFVTERLNEVFGVGKWSTKNEFVATYPTKPDKNGFVSQMVVTKTTLDIPEYGIHYECFGGNDNDDVGDAFKGSTTDAITKIASYMGIGAHVWKNDPYASKNPAKPQPQPRSQVPAQPQPRPQSQIPLPQQTTAQAQIELEQNIDRFLANCNTKQDLAIFCGTYGDIIKSDKLMMDKYQQKKAQILGK